MLLFSTVFKENEHIYNNIEMFYIPKKWNILIFRHAHVYLFELESNYSFQAAMKLINAFQKWYYFKNVLVK